MIFYSVINNNKIVIRQLLWIRVAVCVSWLVLDWRIDKSCIWGLGHTAPLRASFSVREAVMVGNTPKYFMFWGLKFDICNGNFLCFWHSSKQVILPVINKNGADSCLLLNNKKPVSFFSASYTIPGLQSTLTHGKKTSSISSVLSITHLKATHTTVKQM